MIAHSPAASRTPGSPASALAGVENTRDTERSRRIVQNCDLLQPLLIQTLKPEFWRFLGASLCFDFGFGTFFFLFNLYLAAVGFNERSIGLFTSAFTCGSLVATLPAGLLAKRFGLRPLLAICMVGAPFVAALRVFALHSSAQLAASFLLGCAMCGWAVCTPPALARLTGERNRSLGFSLNFGAGIGMGVIGALAGGRLPQTFAAWSHSSAWLHSASQTGGMRLTLLLACIVVLLSSLPLGRMNIVSSERSSDHERRHPEQSPEGEANDPSICRCPHPCACSSCCHSRRESAFRRRFLAHPRIASSSAPPRITHNRYLTRFLIAFGIWTAVSAAFAPFAGLYMLKVLRLPLSFIGEAFAVSQLLQVLVVLATPFFNRKIGSIRTIVCIQLATAVMLVLLCRTTSHPALIAELVIVSALQFVAGPSIYTLIMTNTPDAQRSTTSSAQSITSSVAGMLAAAGAGLIVFHFGYPSLFAVLAVIACLAAFHFAALPPRKAFRLAQQHD